MKILTDWKDGRKDEMNNMADKNYKLTNAELKTVKGFKTEGKSWALIRDDMFYTYTDGFALTKASLTQQYHRWKYAQDAPENPKKGTWELSETILLIEMYNAGVPSSIMATTMNRKTVSIRTKLFGLRKAKEEGTLKLITKKGRKKQVKILKTLPTETQLEIAESFTIPKVIKVENESTSELIIAECQSISNMLIAKNKQYGDSVSQPVRIFSKANSSEQIKVRIDDKISRLVRGDDSLEPDEDIIDDLIGYLILLKIQMNK